MMTFRPVKFSSRVLPDGLSTSSQLQRRVRLSDPRGFAVGAGEPPKSTYPKRLPVICNNNKGIYLVDRQVICCLCQQCKEEAAARQLPELELSPTDFERHSGDRRVGGGGDWSVLALTI